MYITKPRTGFFRFFLFLLFFCLKKEGLFMNATRCIGKVTLFISALFSKDLHKIYVVQGVG